MPTPGYVYALVNPAYPKYLKIGKTTSQPEIRAAQISAATGVPTSFHVAFDVFVSDCDRAEEPVHSSLAQYRFNADREFFAVSMRTAIEELLSLEKMFRYEESSLLTDPSEAPPVIISQEHGPSPVALKPRDKRSESLTASLIEFDDAVKQFQSAVYESEDELKGPAKDNKSLSFRDAFLAELAGDAEAKQVVNDLAKGMTVGERMHSLCLVGQYVSDPITQFAFYKAAEFGGNAFAKRRRKLVEKRLSVSEIVEAIERYRDLISRFRI